MTPAIVALNKAGIQYKLHEYPHDPQAASYGDEAAHCLKVDSERVFKTLVISGDHNDNCKQLAVAIVPVNHQLDLKAVAKSIKTKKVCMADAIAAQNATGYIVGGISPLGQKKRLPFILDSTALTFETIFVSGGKRGLEIELNANHLIKMCDAITADLKALNNSK